MRYNVCYIAEVRDIGVFYVMFKKNLSKGKKVGQLPFWKRLPLLF